MIGVQAEEPGAVRRDPAPIALRQNGVVVDAMMPKVVPSARRKRSAGAVPSCMTGSTRP